MASATDLQTNPKEKIKVNQLHLFINIFRFILGWCKISKLWGFLTFNCSALDWLKDN